MNFYDPQKPLISIHIPKCAGTSFSNVLGSWFGAGLYQHYHDEQHNQPPVKHVLYTDSSGQLFKPGLCIHGHFSNVRGNGVRDYYPEVDQFITVLRNPFDLHLSNYFYVRRLATESGGCAFRGGKQHPIIENGWTLEDYLGEAKNSFMCNFLPADITLDNFRQILDEQFIFIGLSEYLQESVNILANRLGFPVVQVPETNISEWDEEIPEWAVEDFFEHNRLEMEIYNYVSRAFEERLSVLKPALGSG